MNNPLRARLILAPRLLDLRWWLHLALTGVMTWFSYLISRPEPTMVGPNWAEFRAIATEPEWAAAFGLAAIIGIMGLLTTDRWLRVACIFALATAHASVAILFYQSAVPDHSQTVSLGVGSYGIYAGLALILLLRRLYDAIQTC